MKVGTLWQGWGWMRMNVSFWQVDKLWFASIEIRITLDVHSRMLITDQLEDHLQTSRQVSNSLTLTSTRYLSFKCLVVHVKFIFFGADRIIKSQAWNGLPSLSVLRPFPQHWKSTRPSWTSTCHGIASAMKGQKPGTKVWKSCNENGIMVYYWCSRLLRH